LIRLRAEQAVDCDVAVVGAGPAGAAAACHLARVGFRVVLLDQRRFPRDKVCGDFVGPAALAELERLGLLNQSVFQEANQIRGAALYLDGAKLIAQPVPQFPGLPGYGLCVPRLALDNAILGGAIGAGARVLEGTRVTGYTVEPGCVVVAHQTESGQRRFTTRLLIGADGSSSQISRILRGSPPPRRDRILAVRAYYEDVEGPQEQADLYFSGATFPGYCWIFPTGGTSANVGVGILLETCPPLKQPRLGQLLTDIIETDPAVRIRLSTARMRGKIVGWPLVTFNPHLPITGDRVILIGDAAGLINPLNGEGIQYAMQSARWAAETLARPLLRDELSAASLKPFADRVLHELRYDMALARLIIDLISNRTLNPVWLKALRIITHRAAFDREYARLAGAILAGIAPARDALGYRILWGTVQSAVLETALTVAMDAVRGPERLWKTGVDAARLTSSMAFDSVVRPTSSLNWGLNCMWSAVELGTQVAASMLEQAAGRKPAASAKL
jgi:geranylgeranyl reductase family protein